MSDMKPARDLLGDAAAGIWEAASPEKRRVYQGALEQKRVFAAWNEVMERERGRDHVTGLYYVPDKAELVVYVDGPVWCQELHMMREVLRGRLSFKGVDLSVVSFKVSRKGYERGGARPSPMADLEARLHRTPLVPTVPLTSAERADIHGKTASISDRRLRKALENAMEASFEWKKGQEATKRP